MGRLTSFFAPGARRGVACVYLFGSVARGQAHRESDVDVGILFDRAVFPATRDRTLGAERLSAELMAALRTDRVDVIALNDAPPLFARHIVTRGIRVFCADDAARHAFERDTLLRAADLQPFVERARRRMLETLLQ